MTSLLKPAVQRRKGLDVLRIVAIVGVVSIHTFGALRMSPEMQGRADWWVPLSLNAGFIWAVPVFVMISGALLLDARMYEQGTVSFYRRRLVRLAPAFIFWQLFYLIVVRQWITGLDEGIGTKVGLLLRGEPYTHLYFLWLIVGLYAVAPALHAFLREGKQRRAVALAAVLLLVTVGTYSTAALLTWAGQPTRITLLALTQWLPYVGYFVAGYALRNVRLSGLRLWGCGAVATTGIVWTILQAGLASPTSPLTAILPQSYLGPVTAIVALALFVFANGVFRRELSERQQRTLTTFSDATFGVYLVHFVLLIAVRTLPWFAESTTTSVASGLLVWIIVVLLSFAVVIPLRRVPAVRRLF